VAPFGAFTKFVLLFFYELFESKWLFLLGQNANFARNLQEVI
jgi:hypothetical protein